MKNEIVYMTLNSHEVEFLRMALNEALDNVKNAALYNQYHNLLDKLNKTIEDNEIAKKIAKGEEL